MRGVSGNMREIDPALADAAEVLLKRFIAEGLQRGQVYRLVMDGVTASGESFGRVVVAVEWHGYASRALGA